MNRPETEAARRILSGTSAPTGDERTRAMLETFYALVQLLPPGEVADDPVTDGRAGGADDARGTGKTERKSHRVTLPVAALVAIIAALIFVTALLFLPRDSFAPEDVIYLSGTGAARAARGVVLAGNDETVIFASGLSELTRGYRYVAWRVDEDVYRRVGSMIALGTGRARLRTPTVRAEQIEITIEPSTSTGEPEGPTVLAGFRSLE